MNRPNSLVSSSLALALLAVGCGGSAASSPSRMSQRPPPASSASAQPSASVPRPDFRAKAPEAGASVRFVPPVVQEKRLSNGMRLLVVERHDLPIVSMRMAFLDGGGDSTPGLSGFVAAMLPQGTSTRSALQISDEVERLGGSLGAVVDYDALYLGGSFLSDNLAEGMALMADVALHPKFEKQEVERIRSRRLTAFTQQNDSPQSLLYRAVLTELYPKGHPYSTTLLGTEESLKSISPEDLGKRHRRMARPERTVTILVGDVSMSRAVTEAEKALGSWRSTSPAAMGASGATGVTGARGGPAPGPMATSPALDAEPPKDDGKAPGILVLDRPGATQSFVSVAFQGPPRSSPDYEAITLMNAILGGQFTSRLNLNLREKHAYTYGARSSLDWRSRPAPYTSGGAMVRDSTAPALQEIFSEMERMRSELVSAEELENAKRHIVLGLPADFESTADISTAVIKLAVHGLPLDDWTKEASRFEGVTREDVLRVAKTHLPLETARVVIVGDAAAIRKGLETLPRGPVEVRQPASPSPRASATSAPSTKR